MSSAAPPTPIWRAVAALAGPAIVAGLVSTLAFFTDRLLLGRYSDLALGSMQVSGPLLWSVFSVGRALLSGALAVVGRAIGASDADTARRATLTAVLAAGTPGTLVGAIGYSQTALIADVLAGPDTAELRALAEIYMAVVFPVAPLVFFAETGIVCIQARGNTTTPLRIGLVAEVANVVVSAVLLFGIGPFPELGIRGAALGTATSFVLLALLTAYALAQGPFALRRADLHGGLARIRATLRPIVRVSLPTFGEKVIFHTGFLVFATLVGRLGETAMTANQSLIAIESVGFMTATGFGIASGALVAQALGARDPTRARTVGWKGVAVGVGVPGGAGQRVDLGVLVVRAARAVLVDVVVVADLHRTGVHLGMVVVAVPALGHVARGKLAGDPRSIVVAVAIAVVVCEPGGGAGEVDIGVRVVDQAVAVVVDAVAHLGHIGVDLGVTVVAVDVGGVAVDVGVGERRRSAVLLGFLARAGTDSCFAVFDQVLSPGKDSPRLGPQLGAVA